MTSSALVLPKPGLKTALVQALYNEIVSNTSGYYYFIGKTLEWSPLVDTPRTPQNNQVYEAETRERMIFAKKITSADISFTIPRYDWIANEVFDMYDDQLGVEVAVDVTPASANTLNLTGTFDLQQYGIGWLVEGTGVDVDTFVSALTPTQLTLTKRTVGPVTSIKLVKLSATGARSLDTAKFYCLTNDRNVYKCLQNNKGAPSTVKPFSTSHTPFATEDGYIWKFMYTIPGSLQNKFTSLNDIPVTTALRSGFFSQGSISSVTIQNYGSDYQQGDILVVTGDGHLRDNVFRIIGVNILNNGSGYVTPPTLTVSDPFDTILFEAEKQYLTGQYVKADNRIYEVRQGGTSGLTAPTHTSTTSVQNGTTAMRFVGLSVDATAVLDGGVINDVTLSGIVGYVNVTNVGSGYDPENPPSVTITGDGVDATAVANVSASGQVTSITISARGSGYTNAVASIDPPDDGDQASADVEIYFGFGYSTVPTITASAPFTADAAWEVGGFVDEDEIISAGSRFYRVVSTGTGQVLGINPPTHAVGTEVNGECDLQFIGETASLSMFTEKTKARITPIIENGQIVNVAIQDPGMSYTVADISAFGAGSGAVIVPNLSQGDVNTRQANAELLAVPGSIEAIDVLNPGLDYVWATVTVHGDGEGCTAEAVIERGTIAKINVTNAGSGYTRATATITGNSNAVQAYAHPIISPFDGHGKNAVAELFATDIALSTTIARDRNLGFIVDNDYRQLGIIRSPRQYGNNQRFNDFSGSACYVFTGSFSYSDIENDMELVDVDGHRYRVVAKTPSEPEEGQPTSILVQSIDNKTPAVGSTITYAGNLQAIVVSIRLPTINKYSGDLLFIDNRASFQPTDEQTIAIKTVIRL